MINICKDYRWVVTFKNTPSYNVSLAVKSVVDYTKNKKNYLKIEMYNAIVDDCYCPREFENLISNLKRLVIQHQNSTHNAILEEEFWGVDIVKRKTKLDYNSYADSTTTYLLEYNKSYPNVINKKPDEENKPKTKPKKK